MPAIPLQKKAAPEAKFAIVQIGRRDIVQQRFITQNGVNHQLCGSQGSVLPSLEF